MARDGEPAPGEEGPDGGEQRVRARGRHADGEGAAGERRHGQHEEAELRLDGLQAALRVRRLGVPGGEPLGRAHEAARYTL